MEAKIKAILSGLPGVKVKPVGNLWQVSVGGLSGARENGEALARDLRRQYEYIRDRERAPEPFVPFRIPPLPGDGPDYKALYEAELKRNMHAEAPVDVEVPAFLKAEADPPAELSDLIDWTAPPKERQEALLVKLREVAGLIGLAEDRGGRATPELYKKRDRLESGIHFNRPTLTETI